MTILLLLAALIIGTVIGAVVMAVLAGGASEDAYRAGYDAVREHRDCGKESA